MGLRTTSQPGWATLLAAGLWFLASCQSMRDAPSPPSLPTSVLGANCRVHAQTQERAREVARAVDAAFEFLKSLPAARRHEFVEVFVREGDRDAWTGVTRLDGWIELTTGDDEIGPRFIVAHELTHFLLESEWDPMPQVLEEGLCDTLAARFDPTQGARQRADIALHLCAAAGGGLIASAPPVEDPGGAPQPTRVAVDVDRSTLPTVLEALALDAKGLARVRDEAQRAVLYGLGYALVDAIGVEELARWCAQSTGPLDAGELLRRAGVSALDGWELGGLSQRLVGDAEREVLAKTLIERRARQGAR